MRNQGTTAEFQDRRQPVSILLSLRAVCRKETGEQVSECGCLQTPEPCQHCHNQLRNAVLPRIKKYLLRRGFGNYLADEACDEGIVRTLWLDRQTWEVRRRKALEEGKPWTSCFERLVLLQGPSRLVRQ